MSEKTAQRVNNYVNEEKFKVIVRSDGRTGLWLFKKTPEGTFKVCVCVGGGEGQGLPSSADEDCGCGSEVGLSGSSAGRSALTFAL